MDRTALQSEPLLMDLLVKNVSSRDPLNEDELAILKDFRSRLSSKEEWKECLQLAREERARRRTLAEEAGKKISFTQMTPVDSESEGEDEVLVRSAVAVEPTRKKLPLGNDVGIAGQAAEGVDSKNKDVAGHARYIHDPHQTHFMQPTVASVLGAKHPDLHNAHLEQARSDLARHNEHALTHDPHTDAHAVPHQGFVPTHMEEHHDIYDTNAHDADTSPGIHASISHVSSPGSAASSPAPIILTAEEHHKQYLARLHAHDIHETMELQETQNNAPKRQHKGPPAALPDRSASHGRNGAESLTDLRAAQDLARTNLLRTESALAASRFLMLSVGENDANGAAGENTVQHWLSALTLMTNSLEKTQQSMGLLEQRIGNAIDTDARTVWHAAPSAAASSAAPTSAPADAEDLDNGRGRGRFAGNAKHKRDINHAADGSYDDRGLEQRYALRSSSPPLRRNPSPSFGRSSSPSPVPDSVVVDGHRYQLQDISKHRRRSVEPQYGISASHLALPQQSATTGPLFSRVCVQLSNPGAGQRGSGSSKTDPELLQKSRHDQPLFINAELGTVEVVWRQSQSTEGSGDTTGGLYADGYTMGDGVSRFDRTHTHKSHPQDRRALRREKFAFDSIFSAASAKPGLGPEVEDTANAGALDTYACRLARKALYKGADLLHVALACGDPRDHAQSLEPPLALFLGEAGGNGIVHHTIAESLAFYSPMEEGEPEAASDRGLFGAPDQRTPHCTPQSHMYTSTSFKKRPSASSNISRTASNLVVAASSFVPDMTVSAVLVCNGMISDLLSTAPADVLTAFSERKHGGSRDTCHLENHVDGSTFLANAANVRVRSLADYERLVGVLLGRRAATKEVLPLLLKELKEKREKRQERRNKRLARNIKRRQQQARANMPAEDVVEDSDESDGESAARQEELWHEESAVNSSALAAWLIGSMPASLLLTVTVRHSGGESSTVSINKDGYSTTPGERGGLYTTPHDSRASSRTGRRSRFFFTCPYGDNWATPGPDLQALVEALAWPPHLERPPSTFIDNPIAALVLNVNMNSTANSAITVRSTDSKVNRDKERLRMAAALGSARKNRAAPSRTCAGQSRTLDVNIIVGVSDLRSRKAAIHNTWHAASDREKNLSAITSNSLQSLRLASLLDTSAQRQE